MAFYNNRFSPYSNPFLPTQGNIHFGGYGAYGNASTSSYGSIYGNQYARSGVYGYGRPTTTAYNPYASMGQPVYTQRYQAQQRPSVVYAATPKKDEFNWKKFAVNTGSVVAALGIVGGAAWYLVKKNSDSMIGKFLSRVGFNSPKEEGGMEKSAAQFIMKTGKELASEEVLTPEIRQNIRGELKKEMKSMLQETTTEVLADEKFMTGIKGQMGTMLKGTARDVMNDPKFMATVEKKISTAVQNSTTDMLSNKQFVGQVTDKLTGMVQDSLDEMMADEAFMGKMKGQMGKMVTDTVKDPEVQAQMTDALKNVAQTTVSDQEWVDQTIGPVIKSAVDAFKSTNSWASKLF